MNKTITQFRWLVTALMLVAAMVMPFGAWAEENNNVGYAVFNSATGTLTFKYGVKPSAGDNETVYDLNTEENDPGWTTNKSSIEAVVFDETFKYARPTSCFKWFYYCSYLTTITDIQYLNTSEVTSMAYMFLECTKLTSLDLSSFNTQKVKNMKRMFRLCKFTTLDLSSFNTGSVNNMSGMFQECSNLTTLTLPSNFDTSEVTDMSSMFYGCSGLTSLDLSSFNTSKVTEMYSMFNGCSKLTSLDLSNFDTSEVTKMYSMFNGCPNLTSLDLSSFNTSKVTDMSSMFNGCPGLTSLDLSSFDTGSVNDMSAMFSGCSKLNTIYVSDMFTTGNETISEGMFNGCTNLKGAISYGSEKANDKTYANYLTGYFSYGIKTAADLNTFAQYVNGTYTPADGETATAYPNLCAALMKDIALTADDIVEPMGKNGSYSGTFDGRGHSISGLCFNATNTSLFANNAGTIKNLGVVNATIAGGSNGSICQTNSGTISNCFFMGTTEGTTSPGGAVCQTNSESGTITNCYYLSSNDDSNGGKTAAQLRSGEVAWLLNGSTAEGSLAWYQNIDNNETPDAYPVLDSTHGTVYQCTPCTGVYSNTEGATVEHNYDDNGICTACGAYQPATQNESGVYEIGNAGQLYWFAGLVNGDASVCDYDADTNPTGTKQNTAACAKLTADIVVNSGLEEGKTMSGSLEFDDSGNVTNGTELRSWTPIGNYSKPYTGTFDGNGKTVSGLYFNDTNTSYVGLFGYNSGTIQNVGVVDSYFKGNSQVGGVCGMNYAYNGTATITNCYNTGSVSGSDGKAGGVCGQNLAVLDTETTKATITNCYNTGAVSGNNNIGGVCGENVAILMSNSGTVIATITNCYNTGTVSGSGSGVCGSGTIENCYYLSGTAAGGIVGTDVTGSAEVKTADEFASGEVCYLLNGSSPYGVWGQQIGTDDYPVLGSDYKVIKAAQDGLEGTTYWATFSNKDSNVELMAAEGDITVYNATVSGGKLTLAKRSDNRVAAGEGVLLKANSEYVNAKNISESVSATAEANNLVATPKTAQTITADDGYLYRLTYDDTATKTSLGFYLGKVMDEIGNVTSDDGSQLEVVPGEAYLKVSDTELSNVLIEAFPLSSSSGGATDIECIGVTNEASQRNANNDVYDLQGRKVNNPSKGLYIVNGKTVIIKN